MGFFGTAVNKLTFNDLDELVKTKAQENVRLEFKRADPGKDNFLKKLSSFANTVGGYLVLGMKEGPDHKAEEVIGVTEIPGFEAKVTAWCAQELYPPLVPAVSNPIQVPGKGTVAYVVYVEESSTAPHFIEARRGCYVRTNETSHWFDAELANPMELQTLFNRRQQARETLVELKARAQRRIEQKEKEIFKRGPSQPTFPMTVFLSPAYPRKPLVELRDLDALVKGARLKVAGIPNQFPDVMYGSHSQADSLIFPAPRHPHLSFAEVTRYGSIAYTHFFQAAPIGDHKIERSNAGHVKWLQSMSQLLGALYLGVKFGRNLVTQAGFHGLLEVCLYLRTYAEVGYCSHDNFGSPFREAVLPSDEAIKVVREVNSDEFWTSWNSVAFEMWQELYFSLGWEGVFQFSEPNELTRMRNSGLGWFMESPTYFQS